MNGGLLSIFTFACLISSSIQLFCSTNCPIIQVKYSDPFIEPAHHSSCINDTSIKICKGQILAYYKGKNSPEYINYTLGTIGDISERENENSINTYSLGNFTKYKVLINAKTEETRIISDIYCTVDDECALSEIKKLFVKYNNQINPFYELKSLIYVDPPPKKLYCFKMATGTSEQCAITNDNSVCIANLENLKQECSVESDIEIYEEFILTSPHTIPLSLTNESVKCNKNNCNDDDMLAKIQDITRDYAYGTVIMKNNARRQREGINQTFCVFILMFYFF